MKYKPKTCSVCGKEFIPNSGNQKGCSKGCKHKIMLKSLRKRAKRFRMRHKGDSPYIRLKKEFLAQTSHKCQKCGYSECIFALELHHVDGSGNRDKRNLRTKENLRKAVRLWKEGKIKVLCANCHRKEHYCN